MEVELEVATAAVKRPSVRRDVLNRELAAAHKAGRQGDGALGDS